MLTYLALAIGGWLLLSLVLFLVSAQVNTGSLPKSATNALSPGGNMLTSTDTILVNNGGGNFSYTSGTVSHGNFGKATPSSIG